MDQKAPILPVILAFFTLIISLSHGYFSKLLGGFYANYGIYIFIIVMFVICLWMIFRKPKETTFKVVFYKGKRKAAPPSGRFWEYFWELFWGSATLGIIIFALVCVFH